MAIAAIYIILALASFLVWLGMHKEDAWIVVFSGILFMASGLYIYINGFQDLTTIYSQILAIITIFFGAYLTTLSTVEFVKDNM